MRTSLSILLLLLLLINDLPLAPLPLPPSTIHSRLPSLPRLQPPQQALIIPHQLPHRLLHLVDPIHPIQLHQLILVPLVHALFHQQPPVIVRAIGLVGRFGALRQPRGAGLAVVRGDGGEEVELDEAGELAGGGFILLAEGFEEGEVEEGGGGDADAGAFGG